MAKTAAAEHLRSFIDRIRRNDSPADRKEIYREAKQWGFDIPALKLVARFAKMDKADAQEAWATLELYMQKCNLI